MKVSLLFYPNAQKSNKLNGKIPIYMRLIKGRKKSELRLNMEVESNLREYLPLTLTTHVARYSFRQLLAEADIIEMAVIKRMMGHSKIAILTMFIIL